MNSPGIFYLDFYKQICKILQYRGVIDNTLFRFKVHCTLNPTTNPNPRFRFRVRFRFRFRFKISLRLVVQVWGCI